MTLDYRNHTDPVAKDCICLLVAIISSHVKTLQNTV